MSVACLFCGEPEHVSVFEVWDSGEFLLDTCCEGMRDATNDYLNELDQKEAAAYLSTLGSSTFSGLYKPKPDDRPVLPNLFAGGLRRMLDVDGQFLLDWNLRIVHVTLKEAKAFVLRHHRHNKPPVSWRFGAGVRNGSRLIAVVMVGRPVARKLDHKRIVEVNRLCVRTDVPHELVWNSSSKLYSWAAREAQRRGFARVITYTLEHEKGITLRAAGWSVDGKTSGGSWHRSSRPRTDKAPTTRKTRWARNLFPSGRRGLLPTEQRHAPHDLPR